MISGTVRRACERKTLVATEIIQVEKVRLLAKARQRAEDLEESILRYVRGLRAVAAEAVGQVEQRPLPALDDHLECGRVPRPHGSHGGRSGSVAIRVLAVRRSERWAGLPFVFAELKMRDIRADYIVLDTLRVPREVFARIWEAWRDGYTDGIVEHSGVPRPEVEQRWREMIACARDPKGYAVAGASVDRADPDASTPAARQALDPAAMGRSSTWSATGVLLKEQVGATTEQESR